MNQQTSQSSDLPPAGDWDDDRYIYDGPPQLAQPVRQALETVLDPEVALNIVDVGLIYGVVIADDGAQISMTMTSAACPVTGIIIEDIQRSLEPVLPPDTPIHVELVWEPAWTPQRLSPRARVLMGW